MELSVLEETYDGLFSSGVGSMMNGSSQILGVDALDELVNGAKSDKVCLSTVACSLQLLTCSWQWLYW